MMVSAIASGSPLSAAGIMFFFVLGTVPLFFVLGYTATKLGETMHRRFMKIAGVLILALGLYSLYTGAALAGFELPFGRNNNSATENINGIRTESLPGLVADTATPNSEPTININSDGYSPSRVVLPANTKVKIKLVNAGGYSCAQGFTVPKYGIQKIVPPGYTNFIEFTTPASGERVAFMCSMGMYRGEFIIQ
jgi:heme/copper-type cytochrome/quinol oxidase subunit 2